MNLAVETSVFSLWRVGIVVGFVALAVIGFADEPPAFYAGVAILVVAVVLMSMRRGFMILQNANAVSEKLLGTLDLLSLHHSVEDRGVVIPAAEMKVAMRPMGDRTLLSFEWSGEETERRSFLVGTLLKYQRTLRKII